MATPPKAHDAWRPLPPEAWNEAAARHLLRRAGWTARPDEVTRAVREGLPQTLARLFPTEARGPEKPGSVADLERDLPDLTSRLRTAQGTAKLLLQRDLRERGNKGAQDMSLAWLSHAIQPGNEALAKWTLFLSDVYVVSQEKVRQPGLIQAHQDILFQHGLGAAPALTKAVSRSPAMIVYLDLQDSRRGAPNENFARELFELFTLGEGHYSERDIKEAARAFTGYRQRLGEVAVLPRQEDLGPKTVFGKTGRFSGDEVIDLIYRQPAASTFLPREMIRFYLTQDGLDAPQVEALGEIWRDASFGLRDLALRFFGSQLFYEERFRGMLIKSPIQFALGALQDLELDVTPLQRPTLQGLRQMGQVLYQPPNVRGWVGGRNWINSSSLAARRQWVQVLFTPLNEAQLNADERLALKASRQTGPKRFRAEEVPDQGPADARSLIERWIAPPVSSAFTETLDGFLHRGSDPATARLRTAAAALMQAPEYQLC